MINLLNLEVECAIVCPDCQKPKFIIRRRKTEKEGSFEHILEALTDSQDHKRCGDCGANLERGPLPEESSDA